MQQLPLFYPRMRARVRCPYCKHEYVMAGGDVIRCCSLTITLEETARGGFIARSHFPDPRPGVGKPIPQIVGWIIDNQ
jgi:hypothetical protein